MSRLRATLSTNPLDQEIAQRVTRAEQEIQGALRACSARQDGLLAQRRARAVRRDLERVLGALGSVRRVAAPYDLDPDLNDLPPQEPKRPPLPQVAKAEGK